MRLEDKVVIPEVMLNAPVNKEDAREMGEDPAPAVFMNICVGNISRTATEQGLRDAFAAFGEVQSALIIKDKFSGESRGFGFVPIVGFGRV